MTESRKLERWISVLHSRRDFLEILDSQTHIVLDRRLVLPGPTDRVDVVIP
jgi:hypothetical protein